MTVIKSMSCRFKLLVPPFLCSPQLGSRCPSIECEMPGLHTQLALDVRPLPQCTHKHCAIGEQPHDHGLLKCIPRCR